jgi:hypothetical protein
VTALDPLVEKLRASDEKERARLADREVLLSAVEGGYFSSAEIKRHGVGTALQLLGDRASELLGRRLDHEDLRRILDDSGSAWHYFFDLVYWGASTRTRP